MRKSPLELSLYVAGAGAFGVFLRWMEDKLAFNELGLADPSAFHVMVPVFLIACGVVFWNFLNKMDQRHLYVPTEIEEALGGQNRLQFLLGLAAGGVMALGGLLLFSKSETDAYPNMLRVLAGLALLTGIAFPLVLTQAEREAPSRALLCPLMLLPVLLFAVWLIYSYRCNSINSVPLSYGLDMLVAIVSMVAAFRLAGFAFGSVKGWRCLLAVMLSSSLCLMSLADERYLGMEVILLAFGGQMLLITWLLVKNIRQGERQVIVKKDDGFEHL